VVVGWVIASALALALLALRERIRPPAADAELARSTVERARSVNAATWAPEFLEAAEAALRSSLAEQRRQEVRFVLLRTYEEARKGFLVAEQQARRATREALNRKGAAQDQAAGSLSLARRTVGEAESLARRIRLEATGRRHLQRARAALVEASSLYEQGEFLRAAERAEDAARDAREAAGNATDLVSRFVDERQLRQWRQWVDETIRNSAESGAAAIIVYKEKHLLVLYVDGKPVRSYRADMGRNVLSTKLRAGDEATPEGRYRITARKGPGQSRYHRALLINYPNDADRRAFEAARRAGRIPATARLGGLIEIHGEGGRGEDWTDGCVAISNSDIDQLFRRVRVGTPVTIVGGDGRDGVFSELARSETAARRSQ
jgi:lipoprotein-anchoring transpeptidase ErfK/SrfK